MPLGLSIRQLTAKVEPAAALLGISINAEMTIDKPSCHHVSTQQRHKLT